MQVGPHLQTRRHRSANLTRQTLGERLRQEEKGKAFKMKK